MHGTDGQCRCSTFHRAHQLPCSSRFSNHTAGPIVLGFPNLRPGWDIALQDTLEALGIPRLPEGVRILSLLPLCLLTPIALTSFHGPHPPLSHLVADHGSASFRAFRCHTYSKLVSASAPRWTSLRSTRARTGARRPSVTLSRPDRARTSRSW